MSTRSGTALFAQVVVAGIFGSNPGKKVTKQGRKATAEANARLKERGRKGARPEDASEAPALESEDSHDR